MTTRDKIGCGMLAAPFVVLFGVLAVVAPAPSLTALGLVLWLYAAVRVFVGDG